MKCSTSRKDGICGEEEAFPRLGKARVGEVPSLWKCREISPHPWGPQTLDYVHGQSLLEICNQGLPWWHSG